MKKILSKLPWVFVVAGLIAALAYGFWPQAIGVDLVEVKMGSLEVMVDDDGETRIREKFVVSAPVAGNMLRIQLHAGDVVEQGKTELLRIEPGQPALLDARTRAEYEARVRATQAALEQRESTVRRYVEALELADHDYTRAKNLVASQAIATSEFDAAEHTQRIASADLESARFAVKVAQFELETAEAALARYESHTEPASGEQSISSDNLESAGPIRLVSPITGQVLNVFHEDASIVTPGLALLEIGDPLDLELEIDVLTTDAVKIQPGDRVYVEHWGGPAPLEAVVRLVEPSAFLKISALGVDEKRVNVIAAFVDTPGKRLSLGDGFRIEARIVVDSTAADSIKVDSGALFRDGEEWFVYRIDDGRAVKQQVEPGKSSGLETEIKNGLSAGDRVVLHPSDKVRDGVKVKVNN